MRIPRVSTPVYGVKYDRRRAKIARNPCSTQVFHATLNGFGRFGPENYCKQAINPVLRVNLHRLAAGGPIRIPIQPKGIAFGRNYYMSESAWRTLVWDRRARKFYGVDESATLLFSFDPQAGKEEEVRELGQLCIPTFWGQRDVRYATLSLTLGHDGKLYY